jgi:hypothetical protein
MTSPRPCLGHPSRTAAIAALRKDGLTTAEIAARIGDIKPKTVRDLERAARLYRRRAVAVEPACRLHVSAHTMRALAPHAEARDIHVNVLARKILETIAAEGMVDAVLDDGVGA